MPRSAFRKPFVRDGAVFFAFADRVDRAIPSDVNEKPIRLGDFERVVQLGPGEFVYCDPPCRTTIVLRTTERAALPPETKSGCTMQPTDGAKPGLKSCFRTATHRWFVA